LTWSLATRWALVPMGGGVVEVLVALFTAKRYFRGALEEVSARKVSTDTLVSAGVVSALLTGEALTSLYYYWWMTTNGQPSNLPAAACAVPPAN